MLRAAVRKGRPERGRLSGTAPATLWTGPSGMAATERFRTVGALADAAGIGDNLARLISTGVASAHDGTAAACGQEHGRPDARRAGPGRERRPCHRHPARG